MMMTPRDLEVFQKGMDAVFLVIDDAVSRAKAASLDDVLEKAGVEITSDTRAMAKLWGMMLPGILDGMTKLIKHDSKRVLQELTCMVHGVDPEHMRKLAAAARGEGIEPGAWRRA